MSAPAQTDLAALSTPKKAEPIAAQAPVELPTAASSGASDQADIDDTASIADLPQAAEPDASIEEPSAAVDSNAELATEGTPLAEETADARPDKASPDPAPAGPSVETSMSQGDVHEDASPQVASPQMAIAEPPQPANPVTGSTSNASVENGTGSAASVKPAATQAAAPVTTPQATPKADKVTPRPKQAARPAPPQEEASQPRSTSPWKPMALAPADKPSTSLTKAPTSRPSGGNYGAQVWSALARHKPKAGERGSTTVIFAIGDAGALRFVRVGRSSGSQRLDQLALATVRNAAPYPSPPGGAQSFTIRIDFH